MVASGGARAQGTQPNLNWGNAATPVTPANPAPASPFAKKATVAQGAFAAPTQLAAPGQPVALTNASVAALKTNVALLEERVGALQPILARDSAARDALVASAAALDQSAKAERSDALVWRTKGSTAPDKKTRDESLALAALLDGFARQSDDGARLRRELSQRLDANLKAMQAEIATHLAQAAKLKTFLANHS